MYTEVQGSLRRYPVVGILGPRQVGKTTLAKEILTGIETGAVYLDLELPSDLNKLREPELYLGQHEDDLVILDEIQRLPELFPLLRALVDRRRVPARFLILGSASLDLIHQASESLAGRVIYHELTPFTADEAGSTNKLWIRGGYPESFLAQSDEESFVWREAFVKTYLERDIPQLGLRVPSVQLRRFWTMIAHSHGQLWNASRIAASMGVSAPTVRRYLNILDETFITRQLLSYHGNVAKRLRKSPKVYLRDPGLLHALLGLRTMDDVLGHPAAGSSWEGFVIEQILSSGLKGRQAFFYRTGAGAEIDLVLIDPRGAPVAVEVKYSAAPAPTRGFWIAYRDLGCEKGFVVHPGNEKYPLGEGVMALPFEFIAEI